MTPAIAWANRLLAQLGVSATVTAPDVEAPPAGPSVAPDDRATFAGTDVGRRRAASGAGTDVGEGRAASEGRAGMDVGRHRAASGAGAGTDADGAVGWALSGAVAGTDVGGGAGRAASGAVAETDVGEGRAASEGRAGMDVGRHRAASGAGAGTDADGAVGWAMSGAVAGTDVGGAVGRAASGAVAGMDVGGGDVGDAVGEDWAASGAMWLTGRSDGPALQPPGIAASAARGALLAFEELSELAGRRVRIDGRRLLGERAAAAGLRRQGPRSPSGTFRLLPAADGLVGLSLARPDDVALVPALVGRDVRTDPWDEAAAWLADQPAESAVERARLLGLPACVVPEAPRPRPAALDLSLPPGPNRRVTPLVVDLSSLWAGPLCAHLLGLAGARVVKVESPDRPDGARRGPAAFYDLLHAGHESVVLDLRDRRLRALLDAADVVIESSRPRALRQLGIDADAIVARAEHKTWVSITAYGRTGPAADWVGFGDDTAAAAGLVTVDPGTGAVVPCGDAIADPLAGMHAAVAALASVLAGGSRVIPVALHDIAAATLALAPIRATRNRPADPPCIRRPAGRAQPFGADTSRVLGELT